MNIRYPVRKADGRDYKNYDELLTDIRKNAHGWWLLGISRYWHGGSTSGRHRLRPRCWIRKRRKNPCRSSS
ncbi:Uncharacterised protein [Salmonella enterica subsp. arizonae]|uniref:Uncharacterized protein n=1 Tax=Salmonella enterica subsp. arizonae TaxID=59203 RepID=A0A447R4D3_SALER|nr:Uncharacterised protein [Salmonella enterica subsp. arizonae]